MVISEGINNLDKLTYFLPANILDKISGLIIILKALSIAAIFYIIYIIIRGIFSYRGMKRIERIEEKADTMITKINLANKKINKLLQKK